MKKNLYKVSPILITIILLFFYSCTNDVQPSLYEFPSGGEATPVITSIDPPDFGLAGVTVLTVTGSNFSPTVGGNLIFFNGTKGTVLEATNTQIKVIAPTVVSDTVIVKIAAYKSESFSNNFIYKLKPAVSEYYPFSTEKPTVQPYGICTDNQENVYVSISDNGTKKIIPDVYPYSDFSPKGAETFFRAITIASDNAIYGVRGGIKGIYRLVEGSKPAAFVSSAQGITDNVNDVEFDISRNILWAGGATGIIYRITLDKNVKKFNISGTINAMRIAGSDLFVAVRDNNEEIVWKLPIINSDSLGNAEQYFNVSSLIDPDIKISDLVLSEDGDLYIGTDKTSDPIYTVHTDKSFEILYPGLITSEVYSLSWGFGNSFYMSNVDYNANAAAYVNTTILRIDLQKPGAH